MAMGKKPAMTKELCRKVREAVDAGGWDAVRRDMPEAWAAIIQARKDSRQFVDQCVDRD